MTGTDAKTISNDLLRILYFELHSRHALFVRRNYLLGYSVRNIMTYMGVEPDDHAQLRAFFFQSSGGWVKIMLN